MLGAKVEYMGIVENADQRWQIKNGNTETSVLHRFVGREIQLQQFKAAVESVFAYQEMQMIYIRGIAGLGKTRLLEEFCDYASKLGVSCHNAHVLDFGTEHNQLAIPKLIRSIIGLAANDANLSFAQLNARFGQAVCEERDLPMLYRWLNWSLSGKAHDLYNAMSHETRSMGLQRVIKHLMAAASQRCPLLLCIEDMHWANDDILEVILHFSEALKDTQVILLLTSRKENDPLQKKWSSAWLDVPMLVMNLAPLRKAEATHLADSYADVTTEYKSQCVTRAEGNPLFLEQLLREQNLAVENLPQTIQTLVLVKLDSLSAECRTVARAASVIGQWFTEPALNYVLQSNNFNITPLIENYLVKRVGERYQFVHALIHQGVYQTIAESSLSELHQRCAKWFETSDISLQARHLNRAKAKKAAEIYLLAIKTRIQANDFDAALTLVEEAVAIKYTAIDHSSLWLFQAEIMLAKGHTHKAIDGYQKAIDCANSDSQKFTPLIGLANGLDTLERYADAMAALSQAEASISSENINAELSQIHYLRGNLYFPKGQVKKCSLEHRKALQYAQFAKDSNAEAKALGGLGDAAYAEGNMLTACNYFKQCLQICETMGLAKIKAANRFMLATTRIYLNETDLALNDATESADLAKLVGHKRAEIVSRLTAGWILLDMQALQPAMGDVTSRESERRKPPQPPT